MPIKKSTRAPRRLGTTASITRTVTEKEIETFADVSGDTNPVHLDQAYAEKTMFKGRIAHGMLGAAFISAVLGTKMPGPGAIYMSQVLRFKAPVRIGDEVVTTCTVKEVVPEKKRAVIETVCKVGDNPVIEGEATLMVPKRG